MRFFVEFSIIFIIFEAQNKNYEQNNNTGCVGRPNAVL